MKRRIRRIYQRFSANLPSAETRSKPINKRLFGGEARGQRQVERLSRSIQLHRCDQAEDAAQGKGVGGPGLVEFSAAQERRVHEDAVRPKQLTEEEKCKGQNKEKAD